MARPERNNVDYFPFICEDGNKMFYIEETYGNDGFATFVKLLRELAKTNYHYLDLSKPSTLMFLSAKCKVSKEILQSIISDLVDLGKFDKVLWSENKIVWCQDFVDSIEDAYIKRKSKCITYPDLLLLLISLGVRKLSLLPLKGDINTQSIVKETKPKQIKEKDIKKEYKENIFLTIIEYEKLVKEHSEKTTLDSINFLSDYKIEKGYTTKSDYLTIKRWVIDAVNKTNNNQNGNKQTNYPIRKSVDDKRNEVIDVATQAFNRLANLSSQNDQTSNLL